MSKKYSDELADIDRKITNGLKGSSNLENITNEAVKISQNLSSTWLNMSYEQKSELQQFVFPKGTTFETKNIKTLEPDLFYIKRLGGLPNEKIQIGDDRHLVINNERLDASDHPFELVYSFDVAEETSPFVDTVF